jgi:hypothetical protein
VIELGILLLFTAAVVGANRALAPPVRPAPSVETQLAPLAVSVPALPAASSTDHVPDGLTEVTGPKVGLTPGVRYLAKLEIPFGAGLLASEGTIKSKAAEMGFNPFSLWHLKDLPAFFPDRTEKTGFFSPTTYFVAGTYNGPAVVKDRPGALARVWTLGKAPPPAGVVASS